MVRGHRQHETVTSSEGRELVRDDVELAYVAFLASRMDPARRELNLLREDIYKLGQELGQPIWVAEWSQPELRQRPPEDVQISCLRRVREVREFISVVDGSYGTPWNLAQLCVLELEILTAALADKPFHFFVLDPYEPDPRTETLLEAVRLAKPELRDTRPKSHDDILADLKLRLTRRPAIGAGEHRGRSPGTPTNLDVQFLDGNFTPLREDPSSQELIRDLLSRAASETDEATRLVFTWMAIRHLCATPYSDPGYAEFLPLWDAALSQWASAAAWYGLHGHHYLGRLAAVNTLIWIRERMAGGEDQGGFSIHGTYGGRASEYYSMSKMTSSRAWKRTLLRRALADVNHAVEEQVGDRSGLLAIRGSVLQALGKRCAGLRDYQTVLRMRMASCESPGRIGEAQAELGMGFLRVGLIWKAGRYLRQGVANLERSDRYEFTVRALYKLAVFYTVTLRRRKALEALRGARDLAKAHEVQGQLRQILPMLHALELLSWRGLVSRVLGQRKAFRDQP